MCSHIYASVYSFRSPVYSTTKCLLCPGFSCRGVREHARAPHTPLHHARTRECYLIVCSTSSIYLILIDFGIILRYFIFTRNLNIPEWQVTDYSSTADIKDAAGPRSTDSQLPRSANHPVKKREDYGEILSVSERPFRSLSYSARVNT